MSSRCFVILVRTESMAKNMIRGQAVFHFESRFKIGCCATITVCVMAAASVAVAAPIEVRPHVEPSETADRYVTVSGLQSWIVTGKAGERRIVFTTADGMTIQGPLVDQNGRDIATALLAVSASAVTQPVLSSLPGSLPELSKRSVEIAALSRTPDADNSARSAETGGRAKAEEMHLAPSVASTKPATAAQEALDDKVAVLPAAADATELLKQAGWFTAWFSAGKPKEGAPVLYFMADPTCVHCAASTEKLASRVEAGDLDLRVILAPILSKKAVYEAASIIQSEAPNTAFLTHEKSIIGSTPSTLKVREPNEIEADVVRALQRNVVWGRTNNVKGVPFWIYEGQSGPTIAAGRITDEIIGDVRPLPQTLAEETGR